MDSWRAGNPGCGHDACRVHCAGRVANLSRMRPGAGCGCPNGELLLPIGPVASVFRGTCENFLPQLRVEGDNFSGKGFLVGRRRSYAPFLCHASCRVLASPLTWRRFQPSMFQASRSRLLRLVLSCPIPFLWHTHNRQQWGAVGAGPLRPVPSRDAGIAEREVGSLRQFCGKMPVHLSARFLFVLEHAGISQEYEGISLEYAGIALEYEGELGNLSGIYGNIREYPGIASPRVDSGTDYAWGISR